MNIKLHYDVPGDDFTRAGEASGAIKRTLKQLGFPPRCGSPRLHCHV